MMKRFFVAFSAMAITVLALSTPAQAQDAALDIAADELTFDAAAELGAYDLDATLEMARPGRPGQGPGWGPGPGHGPGYGPGWGPGPGHGPGYGPGWGPGPGHGPQPPPPPPPVPEYETIYCGPNGGRYAECFFDPRGVRGVSLSRQVSHTQCIYGQNYGIYNDRVWVQNGCRAEFTIQRRFRR